ncbi:hypothetical protein SAMN05444920_119159 [Nonomuraea solani]|uniref:Uncharacterized protein n=1 Tax=Nonomuraea solani TaxID=1144553 RepID=A0A1H6EWH7_9ACTN|nr:hypothetical protein [Nonomuraea solani]SEH01229.1 hypothetical protein SAMN05444920_119159 [Nonomuraea solani]
MSDIALVALITGSATFLAALCGASWTTITERVKARHARLAAEEQRRADALKARETALRAALAEVQSAVLKLGITLGIVLDMRLNGHARLDGEDLPTQIRQARTEYWAAKTAIRQLQPLCPPKAAERLEELSLAASHAFGYARSVAGPTASSEKVESDLESSLRALSDSLFANGQVPV